MPSIFIAKVLRISARTWTGSRRWGSGP